eukprot:TRINITY_DN103757_c0_g1_i1.p1 TRINITY_DN103757_c0_g1~~TRINITY_DN103757_c0_g1_i1.p1  ORF type:complete len:154 (-),score=22.47 TRINITY_DN103757_c0_g1_i1:36-497(-)
MLAWHGQTWHDANIGDTSLFRNQPQGLLKSSRTDNANSGRHPKHREPLFAESNKSRDALRAYGEAYLLQSHPTSFAWSRLCGAIPKKSSRQKAARSPQNKASYYMQMDLPPGLEDMASTGLANVQQGDLGGTLVEQTRPQQSEAERWLSLEPR